MEKITIGFSSCPNDTFIFDALLHNKIDTQGLQFIPHIADVEELNHMAIEGTLACTKMSFFAFLHSFAQYHILDSGSALGYKNGPLFICSQHNTKNINTHSRIALPGKHTTAHLLFSIAYPEYTNKMFMQFSDIEHAIQSGEADAGVIIHENRFTYAQRGFEAICDLGNYWEQHTHSPIPLGCIATHKHIPLSIAQKINSLIQESILYARAHPAEAMPFIQKHAQNLSPEIIEKHIALFVNDFSIHLQNKGKQAIYTLITKAVDTGIIPPVSSDSLFLNP
ncbi:MAG: 1,4-dihydroxy-6-naphthoate synthase [Bacteroidales bacterium]